MATEARDLYLRRDSAERKRLGLYYTPDALADALVEWALPQTGRVLDPSYGGCSFLEAALRRLGSLEANAPAQLVFGFDVDELAAHTATEALRRAGVPRRHLLLRDFLSVSPAGSERFAAVVGNPPYVRSSAIDAALGASARDQWVSKATLSGQASLWAVFVLHSIAFVRDGGRMAFVLPGALLQADYAYRVIERVQETFGQVTVVRFTKQVFPDAQEESLLLLASDKGGTSGGVRVCEIHDPGELAAAMEAELPYLSSPSATAWREELVPNAARTLRSALRLPSVLTLGEVAKVRIGSVTGANEFFVRSVSELSGAASLPVIARSKVLRRLAVWRDGDQQALEASCAPSRLLTLEEHGINEALAEQVLDAETRLIHERSHCRRRNVWYVLEETVAPDAFLPYMGGEPAGIVENRGGSSCTNAVHRVWWAEESRVDRLAAIASSWTSLWALGHELHGRTYGGGVLKIEPGCAQQLPIVVNVESAHVLDDIDALLRKGCLADARERADQAILVDGLGFTREDLVALRDGADVLARRRVLL